MFSQFELKFSATKARLDARLGVTYLFDPVNGVGVSVHWHADDDDSEGERVDAECLGGHRYSYTVPVGVLIRVLLTVAPGGPEMVLTPVLVAAGVESTYPAVSIQAGDLYHTPVNLEMDSGEENVWVLRDEHGKQVLEIVVRGE